MKQLFSILSALVLGGVAEAQHYIPVDETSSIVFAIKSFGINTSGSFKGLKGTIAFEPENIFSSSFNVNVDAKTISTSITARDNHLKNEEYFDVMKFPLISFVSSKLISKGDKKNYIVEGKLMIKGIVKEISFPFVVEEQPNGFLFTGSFSLNRKDFTVGKSSLMLSDKLNVSLKVFAKNINQPKS